MINDIAPIRTAARKTRRVERECCVRCGRPAARIEQHHVAGRNHDPELTVPLCGPCHDLMTEELRCAGVDMRKTPDEIERVARSLKGTAMFFKKLAESLWKWAEILEAAIKEKTK